MRLKQDGFAMAGVVVGIAAASLTAVAVQNYNSAGKRSIDSALVDRESQEMKQVAVNAASRFKSLIAAGEEGGKYQPAVFATNYFEQKWKLRDKNVEGSGFTLENPTTVAMSFVSNPKETLPLATKVFQGENFKVFQGESPDSTKQKYNIQVLDIHRDSDLSPDLVTSVDIKVESLKDGHPKAMKFRVPVNTPEAKNPKFQYRVKGGSYEDVTGDLALMPGTYEFQAFASGVVYYATYQLNSDQPIIKGWNGSKPEHSAVTWDSENEPIGSPYEFTVGATDSDTTVQFDHTTCKATGWTDSIKFQAPMELKMSIYGVDKKLITGAASVKISIRTSEKAIEESWSKDDLTPKDYETKCVDPGQCPFVGPSYDGSPTDLTALHNRFANEVRHQDNTSLAAAGDLSAAWTYDQAKKYGITKVKLCVNVDKPVADLNSTAFYHDADIWTYNVKSCKKNFLLTRTSCGCVSEDTKILMGDGKTEKRIDQIQEGEKVWNPVLKKAMPIRNLTQGPEKVPMLTLKTSSGELNATGNHPFPTPRGMKPTFELETGDQIRLSSGAWAKVESIEVKPSAGKNPIVWNIEIDAPEDNWDAHHYVANGIDTGDLFIQRTLESNKSVAKN